MTENPFRQPSSHPPLVLENSSFSNVNSSFLNRLFHGPHLGLRILRTLVYAVLPLPILVALFFVITDLFYFNHHDPEFLRLSESYEAGYLLFDYMLYFLIASFYLALPLLAFSAVIEFVCKRVVTRMLTGVGFGLLISMPLLYFTPLLCFTFASRWEFFESCVNFLNPVVVLVGVSLFASLFSNDEHYLSGESFGK